MLRYALIFKGAHFAAKMLRYALILQGGSLCGKNVAICIDLPGGHFCGSEGVNLAALYTKGSGYLLFRTVNQVYSTMNASPSFNQNLVVLLGLG